MKQSFITIIAVALLLNFGCSSTPDLHRITLQSKAYGGAFYCFYSFTAGLLTPPINPDQVDILYYFDSDDCSQGALIGKDDRPGFLFPIGQKPWSELVTIKNPPKDEESVGAILPLTKDKEGFAFRVKTRGGEFIPVKIKSIQSASYSDIISGDDAAIELEWAWPNHR